ncbi:MAG: hypothetical protein F4218_03625 [Synechococcus sp. SB0677_bin_5]|nr:hypothetical protein [Synechococcus sp. SB0677_bin_5]
MFDGVYPPQRRQQPWEKTQDPEPAPEWTLSAKPRPHKATENIWCYWAQGYENAPEIVKYCLASWKRHNPNWDVRFLTSETVSDYIDTIEMDAVFQKSTHFDLPRAIYSDFVRLRLLSSYGGVWIDAKLLCMCPLDTWLHTLMAAGVFMFRSQDDNSCPVINGFIAGQKNNPLIKRWLMTFESYFYNYQLVSSYYTFESSLRKHRSVQAYCITMYLLDFLIKFDRQTRLIFCSIPSLDGRRLFFCTIGQDRGGINKGRNCLTYQAFLSIALAGGAGSA